ncbi:MAG: septum formation initiator family protein [Acidimicrobiia bacterium]|nr:septum formation initiator family protein [Acidimicrobiia bacterium]
MARDKRRQGARHSPLVAVVLIAALAVTLAGIFPFRQILAQNRQVETTEAKLAALEAENALLEDRVVALNTDVELERIAREEYGLVEEGEIGFTAYSEPGSELPAVTDPVGDFDDRNFAQKMWDFLTGRDLDPDG